jgi:hypothetical protein
MKERDTISEAKAAWNGALLAPNYAAAHHDDERRALLLAPRTSSPLFTVALPTFRP